MAVHAQPPIHAWSLEAPPIAPDRRSVFEVIDARARRLGAASLTCDDKTPIIATGHQAWLWHPGILAKYLAMAAAKRQRAASLHVVVDHDVHEAMRLELPVLDGDRLHVETLTLAQYDAAVPTGSQPPVDLRMVNDALDDVRARLGDCLAVDVTQLRDAWADLPDATTLAEQIAMVLDRLMRPYVGRSIPALFSSDLAKLPRFQTLVQHMLEDARQCAAAYNAAARRYPAARIAPLLVEPNRVELPLWRLAWRRPRRRVFADLGGPSPVLVLDDGSAMGPTVDSLAPRAMLLTAFMRSQVCDLFIHGTGGGVYEQVTEAWWQAWTGQRLAPMAVVSADLHLQFDAPVADGGELSRAVWWAHHLPHNLDRLPQLDAGAAKRARRKAVLLASMDDDRDHRRRRVAFDEIHAINRELAKLHPEPIAEASRQVDRARAGLANRSVAAKRDWCFGLYPGDQLAELSAQIDGAAMGSQPGRPPHPVQ